MHSGDPSPLDPRLVDRTKLPFAAWLASRAGFDDEDDENAESDQDLRPFREEENSAVDLARGLQEAAVDDGAVQDQLEQLGSRLDGLAVCLEEQGGRVGALEGRAGALDRTVGELRQRVGKVERRHDTPEARLLSAMTAALSAYVEEKVAEALKSGQTASARSSRIGRSEGSSYSSNGSSQQQGSKGDKSGKEE